MCKKCDIKKTKGEFSQERREVLSKGRALAALALTSPVWSLADKAYAASELKGLGAMVVTAYGASVAKGKIKAFKVKRRALRDNDVKIKILYAGICHSDIHTINEDWGKNTYPVAPGHEIVGQVTAIGKAVKKHKVGDYVGVGCMVDSCGECENCKADREQNCLKGTSFTYGSPDKVSGGITQGGYSTAVVVQENFVLKIPKGMDISRAAPILCAGITTFSPMQHWDLKKGQEIGVVGVGGLGHMAIKIAVAKGAKVTAFTTSKNKVKEIEKMGAKAVVWNKDDPLMKYMNRFDLMIGTVPYSYDMQKFMNLLKLDATFVNVGMLQSVDSLSGMMMGFGRKSLAGSMIGGIKETQEILDFCAEHKVLPDVEVIKPNEINTAFKRVVGKDVKFRFVIDMNS